MRILDTEAGIFLTWLWIHAGILVSFNYDSGFLFMSFITVYTHEVIRFRK
jgi:hypothetical protein